MTDLPSIDELLADADKLPRPAPIPAAVLFTAAGGLELRPLQGCTAGEIALIGRIALVPWFCVEPSVIQNLIEPAGLTVKQ